MALLEAVVPTTALYRIGRAPDPLAWIEWTYSGRGRFDDPGSVRAFRVLYAAEQRLAAFVETLPQLRQSIEALAALHQITPAPTPETDPEQAAGVVPADWHSKRLIATFRLSPNQRLLDLRAHETRETLRSEMAPLLQRLGLEDFDASDVLGRNRPLTHLIARRAYELGFHGIAYKSRFDFAFDCWAVFEGARFEPLDRRPIARDDPDLLEAVRRLSLRLE